MSSGARMEYLEEIYLRYKRANRGESRIFSALQKVTQYENM